MAKRRKRLKLFEATHPLPFSVVPIGTVSGTNVREIADCSKDG